MIWVLLALLVERAQVEAVAHDSEIEGDHAKAFAVRLRDRDTSTCGYVVETKHDKNPRPLRLSLVPAVIQFFDPNLSRRVHGARPMATTCENANGHYRRLWNSVLGKIDWGRHWKEPESPNGHVFFLMDGLSTRDVQ